ncbi:MAG: cyclic nucleotide-binding domain-containing protein [Polyangiaceae bacterium]
MNRDSAPPSAGGERPSPPADGDLAALAQNRLLQGLTTEDLAVVAGALEPYEVRAHHRIVREGAEGDYLDFIVRGHAEVRRGMMRLGELGPGEHFGELAMVGLRRRAATVQALEPMRLLRLSRARFDELAEAHPRLGQRVLTALVAALGESLVRMTDALNGVLGASALPRRAVVRVRLPGGEVKTVPTGTAVGAVLPTAVNGSPVVAALLDARPVALARALVSDATLSPITLASEEGIAIHRVSATLMVLDIARELTPEAVLVADERVGSGTRVRVVTPPAGPLEAFAALLQAEIDTNIAEDIGFAETTWTLEEAHALIEAQGWRGAVRLLDSSRDGTVPLLSFGRTHALRHGPPLPSSRFLKGLRVRAAAGDLWLDPGDDARGLPAGVPDGLEAALARTARRTQPTARAWLSTLKVNSVGEFNAAAVTGRVAELIRVAEGFQEKRIGQIADAIAARRENLRLISIAGPSSSGKTTFIKRLTVQLIVDGIQPIGLSLDDYYADRERCPREENGDYDFEHIEALDLADLQADLAALMAGQTITTSHFDFKAGKRHPRGGPQLSLRPGQVLMVEGIHGLNPRLIENAVPREQRFQIFVHPATGLQLDRAEQVSPVSLRLLRRLVRDRHQRGSSAAETILRFPSVRRGELRWIEPYRDEADEEFDTSLPYEPSVLRVYADRYLLEVPRDHPAAPTAVRLRALIDRFVPIYPEHVPPNSLLREFIGGSGFEY